MKTKPLSLMMVPVVLLAAITGCDHGHHYYDDGSWVDDGCTSCVREYAVRVFVTDRYGYAFPGAHVALVVSDVPEWSAAGWTDGFGAIGFSFAARTRVMAHVIVNAPGWPENYTSVLLDEYTYLVEIRVGL